MEIIDLDLDNDNEMTFNVTIEGTRPGEPLCRLMIENEDISFSMQGEFLPNNEVSILVPPLKGILKEGKYDSYLEVLVDDRIFVPLEMKINFEQSVKVVAENANRKIRKPISASANLISSNIKKNNNKEKTRNSLKEEVIEEIKVIHPAKKRRDQRKIITGNDISSMVEVLRKKRK